NFWNESVTTMEKWLPLKESASASLTEKMILASGIKPGQSVLDIATGIGEPGIDLGKKVSPGGRVLAIDLSPERIQIARRRSENAGLQSIIEFREADIEGLELPMGFFNAVFCKWGLMFFPNLKSVLARIR